MPANNNKCFDHNRIIINVYKICLNGKKHNIKSIEDLKHVLRIEKLLYIIDINKIRERSSSC